MRLIDADALFRGKLLVVNIKNPMETVEDLMSRINNAPTIEAEPVKHGRWEECGWVEYDGHGECVYYPHEGCVCTNCRNAFKKEFVRDSRVNVCPNCGAKMDLEVQ